MHNFIKPSLLITALLVSPTFSAIANDVEVNSELNTALMRDLEISESQLSSMLSVEKNASKIEAMAASTLGENFAGSWLEEDKNGVLRQVIATTDKSRMTANLAGAEVRQVRHSLNTLNSVVDKLNGTMNSKASKVDLDDIHTWYPDIQNNRVVVTVAAGAEQAAKKFIATSGVDSSLISIKKSEVKPVPVVNRSIHAGRAYSGCSIGFAVTRGTTKGFVTAGHCGRAGNTASIEGETVGSVQQSNWPSKDYGWVSVRNTDVLRAFATRHDGGSRLDIRIVGNTEAPVGASICRTGRSSGYRCGQVVAKNVTVNYTSTPTIGLTQSTACLTKGDSGGGWLTPDGQAQGMSSGGGLPDGNTNCGNTSEPESFFQSINPALTAYGLELFTN